MSNPPPNPNHQKTKKLKKSAWTFDHSLFGVDTYYRQVQAEGEAAGGLYVMVVRAFSCVFMPCETELGS